MVNSPLRPGPGVLFHFEGHNTMGVYLRTFQIVPTNVNNGVALLVADEGGRLMDFYLNPDDVSRLKQALSAGPDTAPSDKTQDAGRAIASDNVTLADELDNINVLLDQISGYGLYAGAGTRLLRAAAIARQIKGIVEKIRGSRPA